MEPDNWNNAVKLSQLYFLDYKYILVINSSSLYEPIAVIEIIVS